MSPSTTKPQDALRITGHWTCHDCHPSISGAGGQVEFYRHWNREHLVSPKDES